MEALSQGQERILRWREHGPALFAEEALGAVPTPDQWAASSALVSTRRVSIRSGHGTGKSTIMAWTVLWALVCFYKVKVGATAPSANQIHDVVWSEVAAWHRRMPDDLRQQFEWRSDRFSRISSPQEAFAVARTARKEQPEALQGLHAETMVFVIDEASGVPDEIFQAAEGSLSTPGAYVLMASNPLRMDGFFYESHTKRRSEWAALHWSCIGNPLVSQEQYCQRLAREYGEDSAYYRIKVLGDFGGNPDGVIPLHLVESAVERDVAPFGPYRWGLDVARFGEDRTALAKRRGNTLLEPIKWWRWQDTMQVAGILKNEFDATHKTMKPEAIMVDVIGLGAGVVDRAKEIGLPIVGINVAEAPAVKERYWRLRDELWFAAREWFDARDCKMPRDDALIAELTLPGFQIKGSSGKIKVEGKDEMKRRGVTSPDLADAFCLTFAQGGGSGAKVWSKINYPQRSRI